MPRVNEQWAAKVLGLKVNPSHGPDLIGDNTIVEIKFNLNYKRYPRTWTILEYQMAYAQTNTGKTAYWGLGQYTLVKPVKEIKTKSKKKLEGFVLKRELYIVSWEWMEQFPPSETSGQTAISSWNNILRYPKYSQLPKIISSHEVDKGIVNLTEGIDIKDLPQLYLAKNLNEVPF